MDEERTEDQDTEGHADRFKAPGVDRLKATPDEDDTEGHADRFKAPGVDRLKATPDEDDTEGHRKDPK